MPKRAALRAAPLVARAGARPARRDATAAADDDDHALEAGRRRARVHPGRPRAARARAGFEDVRVQGEELLANWFGWFNRTLEATRDYDDIPWAWFQYAFRGYLGLQDVDRVAARAAAARGDLLQPHAHRPPAMRHGLVALGDSITVGEGSMVLGVTPLSWAQWLARALDLPYTSYAVNGAVVADVLRDQLPRVRREYDIARLYAGVNDTRDPGFDAEA